MAHIGLTLRKNYAKLFLAVKLDFYIQTGGEYHEKVVKFGEVRWPAQNSFKKVGNIIHADKDRRYVVPSAPENAFPEDIKATDMLYDCYRAAESGKDFSKNYRKYRRSYQEIISGLKLELSLDEEFELISPGILRNRREKIMRHPEGNI